MIKTIHCTLILVLFYHNLSAQKNENVTGIFMNDKDFVNGKLSFTSDCNPSKNKIVLNETFDQNYITVKQQDGNKRLFKKDIYGYEKCNGNVYRFFGKKPLLLLSKNETILIYKWILPNRPPAGRSNNTNYYFSLGSESLVKKLTFKNLETTFADNQKFLALVKKTFQYNTDLAGYDEANKMYRINYLLKEPDL